MPRIYWYGPEFGKGSTHDRVSHTYPVVNSMRSHAYRMAIDARFNLDSSPEHRTGRSQIGMQQELLDFYVYLHDPENFKAAKSIEDGHWAYGYGRARREKLGDAEGPVQATSRRWVEGLHPLQRAADAAISRSKVH